MDLSEYRAATYQDGGRGNGLYDCWGLVREVLHKRFGHPLLASFGEVSPSDKRQVTAHAQRLIAPHFKEVGVESLTEGVVVAGYIGQRIQHVGIAVLIDGVLKVFHAHYSGVRFDDLVGFRRCAGATLRFYQVTDK